MEEQAGTPGKGERALGKFGRKMKRSEGLLALWLSRGWQKYFKCYLVQWMLMLFLLMDQLPARSLCSVGGSGMPREQIAEFLVVLSPPTVWRHLTTVFGGYESG